MRRKVLFVATVFLMALILAMPISADETLYDETVNIGALSYGGTYSDFEEGDDLIISLQVTKGNDISFYVLDANNYNLWKAGQSSSAHIIRYDIVSTEINFEVPRDGAYYFILDNRDSFTAVTVRLTIVIETGMCLGTILIAVIPIAAIVSMVVHTKRR